MTKMFKNSLIAALAALTIGIVSVGATPASAYGTKYHQCVPNPATQSGYSCGY